MTAYFVYQDKTLVNTNTSTGDIQLAFELQFVLYSDMQDMNRNQERV